MQDLKYWLAFNRVPTIGPARFRLLERAFPSLEEAWKAPTVELKRSGLDERSVEMVVAQRSRVNPDAELEELERLGIQALTWHDAAYPARLKEIYDPPPVLHVKGNLLPEDDRSIAVVGTRRSTAYGREVCAALVQELARCSITIVSGLARGIDAVAHKATLEARGRTLAVLGSGLDIIYPPEHKALAQEIVERGALLSEHPLGTRPDAQNFPRRNRIMSGLAQGVLVVEASEQSGTNWTVQSALEQGRDVFAVPGNVFSPASRGTNRLIQEGAKLVMGHQDILEELNLSGMGVQLPMPQVGATVKAEGNEAHLLRYISHEPLHIDEVRRRTGLPIATVSSTLTLMEIKGLVKQVGTLHYIRAQELPGQYQPVS